MGVIAFNRLCPLDDAIHLRGLVAKCARRRQKRGRGRRREKKLSARRKKPKTRRSDSRRARCPLPWRRTRRSRYNRIDQSENQPVLLIKLRHYQGNDLGLNLVNLIPRLVFEPIRAACLSRSCGVPAAMLLHHENSLTEAPASSHAKRKHALFFVAGET